MVRARWWLAAALAIGLQTYALYRPSGPPSELAIPGLDKVAHMIIFALPVFLVLLALRQAQGTNPVTDPKRGYRLVLGMFAVHAVVSEVVQGQFYRHRSGDPFDVLADLLGIAVGYGAFMVIQRRTERRAPDSNHEPRRTTIP